jgi:hypothetical protein
MAGLVMKYFILKPKGKSKADMHAMASRAAMTTYANVIEPVNPKLAKELTEWVLKEMSTVPE